jgi:energy-coupling factor transporter ATP-binding protein EcfA2
MSDLVFAPATKSKAKARLALAGPSGSGKTYTALVTATALGRTTAVIDTERGSASKYAGKSGFKFDTLEMHRFDPRELVRALAVAGDAGYETVVVDSLSHFWMGTDGMLEQVDNAAKRSYGGNSFGGWKEARPMERQMIDALLAYPGHVIVTMRTKTEWVVEQNERGKSSPKKIGTKPEQREGIEYEFDVVGDMDLENTLVISKTRCSALAGAVLRRPDDAFAKTILDWLDDGADVIPVGDYLERAVSKHATFEDLGTLFKEVSARNLLGAAVLDGTGESTTLGELIKARGVELKAGEAA